MRTRGPIFLTAFVGVFMILKFFLVAPWVTKVANELEQWCVVTLAFAIILGVLNLAKINLKAVMERKKDWGYKLLLLASMFFMMAAGGVKWYRDIQVSEAQAAIEAAAGRAEEPEDSDAKAAVAAAVRVKKAAEERAAHTVFQFAFDEVYTPLSATIYALLAFYVASAAFRAFRAKNVHATLLLVAAVIVMMGRVPIGAWLWSGLPFMKDWLLMWPNTAGQRAIQMGTAIGMIATGLRVIFGVERPYLKG
jgi:hypothetical protein